MEAGAIVIQSGILGFTLAAAYFLSKTSQGSRKVAGVLGIIAQIFWFLWLKPEDFGPYILAIGYFVIYSKVFYESFFPKRVYYVKMVFHDPERRPHFKVLASSPRDIVEVHESSGLSVPCQVEIAESAREANQPITLKQFRFELLHQQAIQQTERTPV